MRPLTWSEHDQNTMFRTPSHTSKFKLIKIILNVAWGLLKRVRRKQMTKSIFQSSKGKETVIPATKIQFPLLLKREIWLTQRRNRLTFEAFARNMSVFSYINNIKLSHVRNRSVFSLDVLLDNCCFVVCYLKKNVTLWKELKEWIYRRTKMKSCLKTMAKK